MRQSASRSLGTMGPQPVETAMPADGFAMFCQMTDTRRGRCGVSWRFAAFGERGVIDTVGIIGDYALLAMVMNTARTPVQAF